MDAALARVRAALASSPTETLLVVTSDHGGGGAWGQFQHGSDAREDAEVPLLLWGSRVNIVSITGASVLDVAPTVLWALGMPPPATYHGRVLLEAFR